MLYCAPEVGGSGGLEVVWEAPAGAGFEEQSHEHTSAYVSVSIRQRQHTSAYVGIHQRRRERAAGAGLEEESCGSGVRGGELRERGLRRRPVRARLEEDSDEHVPKILKRSPTPAYTHTHTLYVYILCICVLYVYLCVCVCVCACLCVCVCIYMYNISSARAHRSRCASQSLLAPVLLLLLLLLLLLHHIHSSMRRHIQMNAATRSTSCCY
jgi:hypothetical protein